MPDKETQTCFLEDGTSEFEDDDDMKTLSSEEEDDDDASSVNTNLTETLNIFDEDPIDVEEYIHHEIHAWLSFPNNILRISAQNIEQLITAEVSAALFDEWMDSGACMETDKPEITKWVAAVVAEHMSFHVVSPPRQGGRPEPMTPLRQARLRHKLQLLDTAQGSAPAQRSPEWFFQRYNLLTASNAYKALGSQAQKNSLIVEKCQSYDEFVADSAKRGGLGFGTAMGWGIKYEPLTSMLYERMNPGTRLGEYGCMIHPEWAFLGASPDGINVEPASEKYGRMVEIKNIVNREITGIPLEHYWIQMQLQMEVCDLDECDFVETRFKEFQGGREEYIASSQFEWKGVVLMFSSAAWVFGKKHFYTHYIANQGENDEQALRSLDAWIKQQKTTHGEEGYVLSQTAYWYLDQYSCVLVKRNTEWFDVAIQELEELWNIVLEERVTGCEHRKPKKRDAASAAASTGDDSQKRSRTSKCLIADVFKMDVDEPENDDTSTLY